VSCQGSVPQAIIAFLESTDFEDAVRKAVSIGGDSDTIACITGGIAQAYYGGVPEPIKKRVYEMLDRRLGRVVKEFTQRYRCG
jgi:ADP-ribosylglycohydrolase